MPAFNAARFIVEAIESVRQQTFPNWELVIVNDGSTDNTGTVARQVQDDRIRVIDLPQNVGLAAVRNCCVSEARGELIAFLDADDRMVPERLSLQVDYLRRHSDVALCGGQIGWFRTGGGIEKTSTLPLSKEDVQAAMLFFDPIATSTVTVRANALNRVPFRPEFPPLEDYDVWQRLTKQGEAANLPERLADYRVHESQSSITIRNANDQKLKNIRSERLRHLFPAASEQDADIHHHLCELTYWTEFESFVEACNYARALLSTVGQSFPRILFPLRSLVRDKLLALTYAPNRPMTSMDRLLLAKTLLKPELRIGWRQCLKDLAGYRLATKQVRQSRTV